MDQWDEINKQDKHLLRSTKLYQQFDTLNHYAQSFGNLITPIGYSRWVNQDKIKQAIYKCTKSTSQCEAIKKQTIIVPMQKRYP